jgi:hypothetical protein
MRESPVDKPAAMQSRRVGDDALCLGDRADDTRQRGVRTRESTPCAVSGDPFT